MSDIKVSRHIIAFIDILGSSKAIITDSQSSLEVVHSAYKDAIHEFDKIFHDKAIKPKIKIFSDNICVAVPCPAGLDEPCFLAVEMMSAVIQVAFLKKKYLTRGGIAIGDYFCDDVMVWGNALVKAYELESKVAVYPRVIIEPELIGELKLTTKDNKSHCKEWIQQDKDSFFYIDFLNQYLKNAWIFCSGMMNISFEEVSKTNDNKVSQKWLWLNSYLNEKLPEVFDGRI